MQAALVAEVTVSQGEPSSHSDILSSSIIVYLAGTCIRSGILGEHIVVLVGTVLGIRLYALEPLVVLAAVVQHEVHVYLDALRMGGLDEVLKSLLSSVQGIDGIIVIDIVAVVRRSRMRRRKPQCRDSESVQIVELVLDTLEIAHPVLVTVRKGIDQELVGGRGEFFLPQGGRVRHQGPDVGPGLGHGDVDLLRSGERDGPLAVVGPFVGIDGHGDGTAGRAGGLVQMDPVCGWRSVP